MASLNSQLYNEYAEQSILAGILSGSLSMEDCQGKLVPESFYSQKHRNIYNACLKINKDGTPPDFVLLSQYVDEASYLTQIIENTSRIGMQSHIETVQDLYVRRQIQQQSKLLFQQAQDLENKTNALLDSAQTTLTGLTIGNDDNAILLSRVLSPVFDQIEQGGSDIGFGIPTGLKSLDNILSGLHPTDLTILAARPRMGKSALASQLQIHLASASTPTAFFSLEMDRTQIVHRMLAYMSSVEFQNIRNGTLTDKELGALYNGAETLDVLPIYIDDSPGLSVFEFKSRARKLVQKHGVKVIFVDYLTKLQPSKKRETRDQEVGHMAEELKNLAKELKVPVVCLAQLNRKCDDRKNPRPVLSDLRESGNIEQEADNIIFLYREAAYKRTNDQTAEIHIAKQRNGPEGTARLVWIGKYQSFREMANEMV